MEVLAVRSEAGTRKRRGVNRPTRLRIPGQTEDSPSRDGEKAGDGCEHQY